MSDGPRYAIGDLADLGGVSRRTVRYYVQEGLLPAPLGVGRGNHYGREHLDRLLQVKALQEAGRSLDEIRRVLDGSPRRAARGACARRRPNRRSRASLAAPHPGARRRAARRRRRPPAAAGQLDELAAWCRQNFRAATTCG